MIAQRAYPRDRSPRDAASAFSLFEVLIALAIVALIASLFVVSLPGLMQDVGSRPLPQILQKAVRDARYQAAARKEMVSLRFDAEKGEFIVLGKGGEVLAERESGYGPDSREIDVRFFQILPAQGVSSLSREGRQEEIEVVHFHPDRSSTPFVAQLDIGNVRSRHRYDPFSDLEIKDE